MIGTVLTLTLQVVSGFLIDLSAVTAEKFTQTVGASVAPIIEVKPKADNFLADGQQFEVKLRYSDDSWLLLAGVDLLEVAVAELNRYLSSTSYVPIKRRGDI